MCALSVVTVSVRLKKRAESSRGKIDDARCVVYAIGFLQDKGIVQSCTTRYNNDGGGKKSAALRGGKRVSSSAAKVRHRVDRDLGV